ncbi:MAG: methyltransferase domain-containing protein [Pirellulales bacterium]|nr:methyltransferase domain-containing protein [Pirellulales bacterium]
MASPLPPWRLPAGVNRGLWDYIQAEHIATDYDEYFAYNSLFQFDEAVLARHFKQPGLLVDLGCGTGRLLVAFARRGFRGLGVDLSPHMLEVVRHKALAECLPIDCLLANLVELDCIAEQSADYCICMFSTLGMIEGRRQRHRALTHVRRLLKPGGLFAIHVHNRWYNLYDPQGRRWVAQNLVQSHLLRSTEPGDKVYDYRGIRQMKLHVWTRGELASDLRRAGFRPREFLSLDTTRHQPLPAPWWLGRLRANGWIVVCE